MAVVIMGEHAADQRDLGRLLDSNGFAVELAAPDVPLWQRLYRRDADAAVVQLGAPDVSLLRVITSVRSLGIWTPIVLIAGFENGQTEVEALDAGVDEYLVKSTSEISLLARLRALIRRASAPRWAPLEYGSLVLAADSAEIRVSDRLVRLSPRERSLLALLLRRRSQIVTRDEILLEVFGYKFKPKTNLIDVHLARLRQKLAASGVQIENVRGIGFRITNRGN